MKCPKCGYLGFETSERCRNCGYDFSLAVQVTPADELPLHRSGGPEAPLADFDLGRLDSRDPSDEEVRLDLDRLIGDDAGEQPVAPERREATQPAVPVNTSAPAATPSRRVTPPSALPLFAAGDDDTPLITAPRPPRPPLAVRRTTPEIPRVRPRSSAPATRLEDEDVALAMNGEPEAAAAADVPTRTRFGLPPASPAARVTAALIDLVLLGTIDAAVVYLTLALAGLTWAELEMLPVAPLIGFFVMLAGGYLITFVAASGQTIGKMATGIKVMGDDGRRVDVAGAVLRAAGCAASLLTLGLGYLPAFLTSDRRALQDRISGTRVVSAR